MSLLLKHDPGPCPVDDCPHTTCTVPESPTPTPIDVLTSGPPWLDEILGFGEHITTALLVPQRGGRRTPRGPQTYGARTASSFSTVEYRRDVRRPRWQGVLR